MKCNKLIICGFTKIYLYRFYIPELVRLANDVQTTQVQELLIQLNLLPHHTVKVMLKYLVRPGADLGGAEGAAAPSFSSSEIYFLSKYTIIL